jgi:hypothetical protein
MTEEVKKQPEAKAAKTKAKVAARGVPTRMRAGMQFTGDAREVEVTAEQLAAIRADKYLTVELVA